MKIICFAPGLGRIKRGMERFFLELSTQLRQSGLDAVCWGTSEAPGVEALAVPSRVELEKLAAKHLQSISDLAALPPSAIQNWALYAEDQLFALPAAMRVKHLLDRGERLLVYARWQGGLVDPSGDSTELLKVLAVGIRTGKAALLVHTDYIYLPINSVLWSAGAFFHSLGPWLTDPLRMQGVSPDAIVELPMCIDAAQYRSSRSRRDVMRAKLGIPPDAFVILSVGVFDLAAKRHDYVLAEIQKVAVQNVFWVVAGSCGRSPVAWPNDARRALGSRFIPLHDVPFAEMPGIYSAADLFVSASLSETFGLVYLEAQMSRLPCIVHDTPITRYLFAQLPELLKPASLIDMRHPGAAAAAISRWIALCADPIRRNGMQSALADFAASQERRFGWQSMAPRYAAAFERIARAGTNACAIRQVSAATADDHYHKLGIQLFEQGKLIDAVTFLGRALAGRETAERWNDWATV